MNIINNERYNQANTNRNWIMIEKDKKYYDLSVKRINDCYENKKIKIQTYE
jgi:DNA modification methylase